MPLAVLNNDGSYTLYHNRAVCMVKRSGIVTSPQIFLNFKPIIYGSRVYSSDVDNKRYGPVVTSTKWVSFSQDPTAAPSFIDAGTGLVDGDPLTPSRGKCYVPKISSYKKVDNGSNLSVSLTSINNGAISNAALKISSATVANTAYINVIAWTVFASNNNRGYTGSNIAFSGSFFDVTADEKTGVVWPFWSSSARVFGSTSSEGTVDSKILKLSVIVASVKKRSNSLCVMPPFISGTDTSPKLYGWGVILEPTSTNTYPEG